MKEPIATELPRGRTSDLSPHHDIAQWRAEGMRWAEIARRLAGAPITRNGREV